MNSIRYCQLLEFLTMLLSPTWLITYYGCSWIDAELASSGSMSFTLAMDEDSSRFTSDMSDWANLFGPLVGWDYLSLGMQVYMLQDSSGIGIPHDLVDFLLGSKISSPLEALLDSDTWTPVGLQLIVEIPSGSNVRYPDLVSSPSRATLEVPPSGSCPKFPPPPSETGLTHPSQEKLSATLSGAQHTLTWQCGSSWNFREAKGNNKVEI